ncbi:MAG: hypothetical protein HQM16_19020, partial [Deltaproteobacteria bacterium]|nr:hypothetical protein [Deltaproteobacteria bacterium]
KRGSSAEVDYLVEVDNKYFPVLIKSGKHGWLKGLKIFLEENPSIPFGIRISLDPPSFKDKILTLPLYAAGQIRRIVRQMLAEGVRL